MSQAITLQADLTIRAMAYGAPGGAPASIANGPRMTIPSGTVLTFPDAVATGPFNLALDAAAEFLQQIAGRAGLLANIAQFNREVVIEGVSYQITYGPFGQAIYAAEGAPPAIVSATIEDAADTILVVTFDQDVNSALADYLAGFSCKVATVARTINSAVRQANNAIVHFTLASAVTVGQAVVFSYNIATGDLASDAGAELQSFTDAAVENNVAA